MSGLASVHTFERASRGSDTELEVFGWRSSDVSTHDPDDLVGVVGVGQRHGVASVGLETHEVHLMERGRGKRRE